MKRRIAAGVQAFFERNYDLRYNVMKQTEEFRRKGIGTQMVDFCLRELRKMGINKIALIAFKSNDAGNAFWNKIGWVRSAVNYYEYLLNTDNITEFIGEKNEHTDNSGRNNEGEGL